MKIEHLLQLRRANLDSAEVHCVIGATRCLEETLMQSSDAISVTAEHFAVWPTRTTHVIDLVVVLVEKRLRKSDGGRDKKELAFTAFGHRCRLLVEDDEVHSQSRCGEGGGRRGLDHGAGNVTPADLGATEILDNGSAIADTTHQPEVILLVRRLSRRAEDTHAAPVRVL